MKLRIPPDVVYRPHEAGVVVMSLRSGRFVKLNSTAGRIWAALAEAQPLDDIAMSLSVEYGVAAADCRSELRTLVSQLRTEKLIEVEGDA
jgi:hypothetical protein